MRRYGPLSATGLALAASLSIPAMAATIAVDESPPGVGVVEIDAGDGLCALREAIDNANDGAATHGDCTAGTSGADTVVLPPEAAFTLTDFAVDDNTLGHTGLPYIVSEIVIEGNGASIASGLLCTLDGDLTDSEFRLILIESSGDLTVEDATLANGCADGGGSDRFGGGLRNAGAFTLRRSTLDGNRARGNGGGVFNIVNATSLIEQSTLSDNQVQGSGGAIEVNGGDATLRNSTVSGNSADTSGGGIQVNQTVTIEHVTLANNTGGSGGGIANFEGTVRARNVILDDSTCSDTGSIGGTWTAEGASFDSGTTCAARFGSNFSGDAALELEPLGDNGGTTGTHAPGPGSDAIDAVPDGECTTFGGGSTISADQRGVSRPRDGDADGSATCDAGSFELVLPPELTVTKGSPTTELPEGGGTVTYNFTVVNAGVEAFTIDALDDDRFGTLSGDPDCQVGTQLSPDALCAFNADFTVPPGDPGETFTNQFTATVISDDDRTDTDTDSHTLTYTDVLPELSVSKSAATTEVPETGGTVTYTFTLNNTGATTFMIDSLEDDRIGTLGGDPDCQAGTELSPDASCAFSAAFTVPPGDPGETFTNRFTAMVSDNDGDTASDDDSHTLTYTDVLPEASVTKGSSITEVPATGSRVTYTFAVANPGTEAFAIDALEDDRFGPLDGNVDCQVGTVLDPGGFCAFSQAFDIPAGTAGDDFVNTFAAEVSDNEGNTDSASDGHALTYFALKIFLDRFEAPEG